MSASFACISNVVLHMPNKLYSRQCVDLVVRMSPYRVLFLAYAGWPRLVAHFCRTLVEDMINFH